MTNLTHNTHPETSVDRGCSKYSFIKCVCYSGFCFFKVRQPLVSYGLHISWGFVITHTQHSVGLLWTNDRPVAETYTWQTTTFIRYRHPWPRLDSNPQSHRASGRRPTPQIAGQHYIVCRKEMQMGNASCVSTFCWYIRYFRHIPHFTTAAETYLDYCLPARCLSTCDSLNSTPRFSNFNTPDYFPCGKGKKIKFHHITCHEGTGREYRYSSTLSLTSELDGVCDQHQTSAILARGISQCSLYWRLVGPQRRLDGWRKSPPPTGIRSIDLSSL